MNEKHPKRYHGNNETEKQAAEKWGRYLHDARYLIQCYKREQDPEVKDRIHMNMISMVKHVFKSRYEIKEGATWHDIENRLIARMEEIIGDNESIYNNVFPVMTGRGIIFKKHKLNRSVMPREIIWIMNKFGLADGNVQTYKQVAESENISNAVVYFSINGSLRNMILKDYEMRQLIKSTKEGY